MEPRKKPAEEIARRTATRLSNGDGLYGKHGHGTHGKRTPTYFTWMNMIQRCGNPRNTAYKHYGARGIFVCSRWAGKDGFVNFLADMGERPVGLTLDRIDNDGPYEPRNCRWTDKATQLKNRRRPDYYDRPAREALCHPERQHRARGMCTSCYQAFKNGNVAGAIRGTPFEVDVRAMLEDRLKRKN